MKCWVKTDKPLLVIGADKSDTSAGVPTSHLTGTPGRKGGKRTTGGIVSEAEKKSRKNDGEKKKSW